MRIKINICGITKYEDTRIAVNLGVDALGFVFSKGNQRYIDSVEIMPGIKNPHKMRNIIKIVQLCGQAG